MAVTNKIPMSKCPICGKEFAKTPQWVYVKGRRPYCSWTCYRAKPVKKIIGFPFVDPEMLELREKRIAAKIPCKVMSQIMGFAHTGLREKEIGITRTGREFIKLYRKELEKEINRPGRKASKNVR